MGDSGADVKALQLALMKLARTDSHKGLTNAGTWLGYWWYQGKDTSKTKKNTGGDDAYSWSVPDSEMANKGHSSEKKYLSSKGETYGTFKEPTQIAVLAFQKDKGLSETGEVDAATWAKLGVAGVTCSVAAFAFIIWIWIWIWIWIS